MGYVPEIMHDEGLLFPLWDEACNTTVYVENMSPHQTIEMSTPEEALSSKKLDVAHLRIFASSIYCDVSKYAKENLEPIAMLGVFLGHIDKPHTYRVYL